MKDQGQSLAFGSVLSIVALPWTSAGNEKPKTPCSDSDWEGTRTYSPLLRPALLFSKSRRWLEAFHGILRREDCSRARQIAGEDPRHRGR